MSFLFISWILPLSVLLTSPDCRSLKEGSFKLENRTGDTYLITRTENTQRENVVKTGLISEFDVKWISDCTYLLYNRRVLKGTDQVPAEIKPDTIINEIVKIRGVRHTVVSTSKNFSTTVRSTLIQQ